MPSSLCTRNVFSAAAVVVAVAIIAGAGLWVWHEQPSFCAAICHVPMDPYLETYDEQFQGRNRKYYTITDSGRHYQEELSKEWDRYKTIIDDIVKGGIEK